MNGKRVSRRSFLKSAAVSAAGASLLGAGVHLPVTAAVQPPTDLTRFGIAEAARMITARQISPVELVDALLARIEAVEPRLGSFITVVPEMVRAAARAAEADIMAGRNRGPMHGIPFGVKDTHYTAGVRTTAATPVLTNFVPDWDATVVRRLKEAGGILIGKLNLPEWSFGGQTPGTSNPWDLTRSPSGSSGGSAAAMAARLIPASTGGDTSASVRGPAAINGVVGMIGTYGRVSRYGVIAISWTLDRVGPITRTVEDNAVMLNVMAGHDPMDASSSTVPVPDYTQALRRGVQGMRIGTAPQSWIERHHPQVLAAYGEALDTLQRLGATLREVSIPFSPAEISACQRIVRISEAAAYHRPFLRAHAEEYDPRSLVRRDVEAGSLLTAGQYALAMQVRTKFIAESRAMFDGIDAFVSPANDAPTGEPAPGSTGIAFYQVFNVNGFPAITVPAGFSTDPPGLPIGIQIAALPWQEETIYAVANAYQMATDWHTRVPPL
jgi:aspartyl-tRNA(Asn)/glutamyl-tRNA(Gln) amidotransferase subunit A